ncbi:MAG: capsule assembly Wzi family protein, partial [Candidatus Binatia bacterium]
NVVNRSGQRETKGANLNSTLDGGVRFGDFFHLYYQPEFSWDTDRSEVRLQTGYAKFSLWNTELEVGRESLWWGPGYRGSMSLSNNGAPLDQVRLSSAEPFHLPWLLRYAGPVKASVVLAQLHDDHDSKLGGWRIGLAPSRFIEVGFTRMFQFGGTGRGSVGPGRFLELLFTQGSDDPKSPLNVNNIMSFDATLRIPDIGRYILVAQDAAFYFDFGWDDTLFGLFVPDKPGGIVGAYLTGLFGDPRLDLRIEYAKTSDIQFTHHIYRSGFLNRGSVLSHYIGTKGSELYARASRWVSDDLLVGVQAGYAEVGTTTADSLAKPREKRSSFGFDLSYQISESSSIFLGYDVARVKDRGFVAGKSGIDQLFRMEFTRSFGRP